MGTFLKRKRFLKQEFITHDIFIFVDEHFPKKESVQTLESGMYACIYMDDFNNEKEYAGRLLKYCMDNKCETKINQNVQKKTNLKTSLNNLEKIE